MFGPRKIWQPRFRLDEAVKKCVCHFPENNCFHCSEIFAHTHATTIIFEKKEKFSAEIFGQLMSAPRKKSLEEKRTEKLDFIFSHESGRPDFVNFRLLGNFFNIYVINFLKIKQAAQNFGLLFKEKSYELF
jgi:hypothetical protein